MIVEHTVTTQVPLDERTKQALLSYLGISKNCEGVDHDDDQKLCMFNEHTHMIMFSVTKSR